MNERDNTAVPDDGYVCSVCRTPVVMDNGRIKQRLCEHDAPVAAMMSATLKGMGLFNTR